MNAHFQWIGRRPGGRAQRGFTLTSLAISLTISGFLIAGAWAAYQGFQVQWKVGAVDQVMDQYGHSAMIDLTNRLCWAWGGEQVQGGRYNRWKFYIDDKIDEHRNFHRYFTTYNNFVTIYADPAQGIMYDGIRPGWNPIHGRQYHWWSGNQPSMGTTLSYDQRDRMSCEGFQMDFNELEAAFPSSNATERLQRHGVLTVDLLMQYRYSSPNSNFLATRTYADTYVRERRFRTQISMRNWDVNGNEYKDLKMQQQLAAGGS
jgi:hypothetical protein